MELSDETQPAHGRGSLWARWRERRRKRWEKLARWERIFERGFTVFLTGIVAVVGAYSYAGRVAWERTQRELEAKGEKLSLGELMPPRMHDALNFYADPLWDEVAEKEVVVDGEVDFVPGVPADKQRLKVGSRKLTPEEIASFKKAYPRLSDLNFEGTRYGVLIQGWSKVSERDDESKLEMAKLTLESQKREEPVLAKVEELLKRPGAHFRSNYKDGARASLPQLGPLLYLGQGFLVRVRAEVVLGDRAAAFRDVQNLIALAHVLRTEPFSLLYMVRLSLTGMSLVAIEYGLKAHAWSEADLVAFEAALKGEDLLPGLVQSQRTERAGFNDVMEQIRTGNFRAMKLSERAAMAPGKDEKTAVEKWENRMLLNALFLICAPQDQADTNRRFQQVIDAANERSWGGFRSLPSDDGRKHASLFSKVSHCYSCLLTYDSRAWDRAARVQEEIEQTRIACGLERYYLAKKEYPEKLEALVPEYMSAVPGDILTGKAMHYKRTEPGTFLLWANGWDGKDDGGRAVKLHEREGDWVWGKP
ncbi:hypothetical protein BH09VER1_BH09VER1_16300 [soil metagenome]